MSDYAGNPEGTYRFLVTLIHRQTGEERLVNCLLEDSSYATMIGAIRSAGWGHQWECWESLLCS